MICVLCCGAVDSRAACLLCASCYASKCMHLTTCTTTALPKLVVCSGRIDDNSSRAHQPHRPAVHIADRHRFAYRASTHSTYSRSVSADNANTAQSCAARSMATPGARHITITIHHYRRDFTIVAIVVARVLSSLLLHIPANYLKLLKFPPVFTGNHCSNISAFVDQQARVCI